MSTRVVPVSTIPAVDVKIEVPAVPYVIVWSIPQNSFAGDVFVSGLRICEKMRRLRTNSDTYAKVIAPVNLEESVPPNVSSPLVSAADVVGAKETLTSWAGMVPWLNNWSTTVGISVLVPGDRVSGKTVVQSLELPSDVRRAYLA